MSLSLNFLFSDGTVLQRGKNIRVWGDAEPQKEVRVSLTDAQGGVLCEGSAAADQKGAWLVTLPPQAAGRGLTLQVSCGDSCAVIRDAAVGEVWIAGGQSNMEFLMRYDADYESERACCENADIRFFDTPRICYEEQLSDFDYSREYGYWKPCDAAHLEYFSAVGYYFAKELTAELSVPVGIVGCNRGGSIAAAWMDEESIAAHGKVWLDDYALYTPEQLERAKEAFRSLPQANAAEPFADAFVDEMMYGMSRERQREFMKLMPPGEDALPQFDNRPGCLFEYMLKRIIPYTARGVIWYQGESDCEHPAVYGDLFLDMVHLWRREWDDKLPFLTVQLSPFGEWLDCTGVDYPIVRAQQEKAAAQGEAVYLVSSSDAGMRYDIHPKKKAPIGHRLALCAEAEIYGRDVLWRAPVGVDAVYEDGVLRIVFSDGEGLSIQGDQLSPFALEREQGTVCGLGKGSPLRFATDGDAVIVRGLDLNPEEKYEIHFACTDYYEVNLYNQAGVPAMPFVLPVRFA